MPGCVSAAAGVEPDCGPGAFAASSPPGCGVAPSPPQSDSIARAISASPMIVSVAPHLLRCSTSASEWARATIGRAGFSARACSQTWPASKLPGMATEFYRTQVRQHLKIGIRAVQKLAAMPTETLHSRKLRSFYETAFQ